jgi:hypothetical protein
METYALEFIAILPDESKQLNDVATVLAQPDELFPSKFIHHENNHCIVGTPIAPRYMEIVPFGDPPKKGMFGINVHLSNVKDLEFMRYHIADTMRDALQARHVYLVRDDVSRHYASILQPRFSLIENALRRFLNRFFLEVVGPEWLKITASPEVYRKMMSRRDRDPEKWKDLFDNRLDFMDFSELGDLITKQSTGFNNIEDLPARIQNIATMEDLQELRHDLESNYSKYFRETFQDRNFRSLWNKLSTIRNKVAHNAPLAGREVAKVESSIPVLERLLRDAELRIRNVKLSEKELETVIEQSEAATESEQGHYHDLKPNIKVLGRIDLNKIQSFDKKPQNFATGNQTEDIDNDDFDEFHIEEWELLQALDEEIENGKKNNRQFLALSTFVRLLTADGYSHESVRTQIHDLCQQGIIEIYNYEGAFSMKSTRSIRRVKDSTE